MAKKDEARKCYEEIFPDMESKARAFDLLAENYYINNFACCSKNEVDLLMFSVYLDQYLKVKNDEVGGNNFELSKNLGITVNRVATLKEKKEIKYPSEFNWKTAFHSVVEKAEYKGGKIQVYIRDQRLFSELQQIIEELGSYTETTLTKKLLVVSPPVFVDLMVKAADDNTEREVLHNTLKEILDENNIDADKYVEKEISFCEALKDHSEEIVKDVILGVADKIPGMGTVSSIAVEHLFKKIKSVISEK